MDSKFRNIFALFVSLALVFALIVGIGVVDNSVKLAQENPFLNKIYINNDLNFLVLRYLDIKLKIPFGLDYFKPLFYGMIIIFEEIKTSILDMLLK